MARGAERFGPVLLFLAAAAAAPTAFAQGGPVTMGPQAAPNPGPAARAPSPAPPAPAPAPTAAPPAAPAAAPPVATPAPPAAAPAEGDARARAEALFQDGKRKLEDNQIDAACDLLAQSDALDPTVSALGLLAACREQQGKLVTAWRAYRETAKRADAGHDERGDFARQRAASLEPRLPKLAVHVARATPGLEVRCDGEKQADPAADIAVEAGPHEVAVSAPGHVTQRVRVLARESAVVTVEVPDLALLAAPEPPHQTSATAQPPGLGARLPAAIVTGAVGLAGLGVGIAYGVKAMNQNDDSHHIYSTCKSPSACQAGADARSSAYDAAAVSSAGFAVGAAGVVVSAALLLWPRAKAPPATSAAIEVTPLAGTGTGGALLRGRF